jgi:pyrimidine-nucleoside phosphorylase
MRMVEIIRKKRDGGTLSGDEIRAFVKEYTAGGIPDYQASAFLMAVWFRGMDERETADLTLAMAQSGEMVDLSAIPGVKVDKHSTGGVADTTTLIVAPAVAACGGKVAKMSGRGLGHTGGTLDKLESIPGLSVQHSMGRFVEIVSEHGLAVIGQTADLAPADRKLYALRDVTSTVDCIPLIASSIMSKKLAAGSDAIVLDVKTGSGAFMKGREDAETLASLMVRIGEAAGRKTVALVTDMNQPLGRAVGNALEVEEAVGILRGELPGGDLLEVSVALASEMLLLAGIAANRNEAEMKVREAIRSGAALGKLEAMIRAQGGDPETVRNPTILPRAAEVVPVEAEADGFVGEIQTEEIGMACLALGAGRTRKDDPIDPAVGIWIEKRLGDPVRRGEPLARIYVNRPGTLEEAVRRFRGAVRITGTKPAPVKLVYARIE